MESKEHKQESEVSAGIAFNNCQGIFFSTVHLNGEASQQLMQQLLQQMQQLQGLVSKLQQDVVELKTNELLTAFQVALPDTSEVNT